MQKYYFKNSLFDFSFNAAVAFDILWSKYRYWYSCTKHIFRIGYYQHQQGLLIPGMASSGVSSISNPAKGLMAYDSVSGAANLGWRSLRYMQNGFQNTAVGAGTPELFSL